jgi:hypothetical protein
MQLFEPLTHKETIKDYILGRARNVNHPRSRRYAARYKLLQNGMTRRDLSLSIENLVGFVRKRIGDLAAGYEHGNYTYVWIKKTPYAEGPWTMKKEPEDIDSYRRVLILNRADLLLHTLIATQLRQALKQAGYHIGTRPRKDILTRVADLIKRTAAYGRPLYLKCDIIQFGAKFDINTALSTLQETLCSQMDSRDMELLTNIYQSFREKISESRCSGSPIDQLLGEWMLFRLERMLKDDDPDLFDNFFVRSGEDMVCALSTEQEAEGVYKNIQAAVRKTLGDTCELHELEPRQYVSRNATLDVVLADGKSVIRRFDEAPGLQFCGYAYIIQQNRTVVGLRQETFEKIKNRIAEYTNGSHKRYPDLSCITNGVRAMRSAVRQLNNLFGYYWNRDHWRFSPYIGVTHLFSLPQGFDDQRLQEQAHTLNHYMLRRLRHLHLRNISNDGGVVRAWREEIDKKYRQMGLRTLIDGIGEMRRITSN